MEKRIYRSSRTATHCGKLLNNTKRGNGRRTGRLKALNINMYVELPILRAMTRSLKSAIETVVNQQLVIAVDSVLCCVRTPVPQVFQPGHYIKPISGGCGIVTENAKK
jgi:hypothetical protein